MRAIRLWTAVVSAIGVAVVMTSVLARARTPQAAANLAIDPDDIGGRSTGATGPEAGVWVIAETTDLPTKFVKIVVTDDRGRYLIPDLPKANYNVWVRGYGLVDSPKITGSAGQDAESEGGRRAERRAPRRSTTRPATGSR